MSSYSSALKFPFTSSAKAVVEFTGGNLSDSKNDDSFSKSDLSAIQLFTYEWTINNYSMIKPVSQAVKSPVFLVGPCKNFELKMYLSLISDDILKIEIFLMKEVKQTEAEKTEEAICSLSNKLTKHIMGLEFLDSSGKTVDYYKSLPYEFKFINTSKVYLWSKEENVSRFIFNDSLRIRAKLSMRFYNSPAISPESPSRFAMSEPVVLKPVDVLKNDMKNLFNDRSRFPDVIIKVGGQYVVAHKSILYTQYPNFEEIAKSNSEFVSDDYGTSPIKIPSHIRDMIKTDFEILNIPNENVDVFLSVLHFIYCKQLHVLDTVDDFSVYEFAKKYGVRELSMQLMPCEIKVRSEVKVEKLSYTWYVKNFSSLRKNGFCQTQSEEFKTDIENNVVTWTLVLFPLDPQNIIINLKRIKGLTLNLQTYFKLAVCKADGSVHEEKEFKNFFADNTICYPGFMDAVSRFLITPELLYNDTLAVCLDLAVSAGAISSDINYSYPSEHPDVDFEYYTNNFERLLEKEYFSDAVLIVEDTEFKVHKAILSARSPVFATMFESDMEEKRSGCARIDDICSAVMKQALKYIYTGKSDDLTMVHAAELYRTADKYEIMDLKSRCVQFIMKNMDVDSACEVLILADLFNDEKMKKAAKNIICRNAAQTLLTSHGNDLITNHVHLVQDIFETLSAVYCSLPPQDMFEKSVDMFGRPRAVVNTKRSANSLIPSIRSMSLNNPVFNKQ